MLESVYHNFEGDTYDFWDRLIVPIDKFEIQVYSIKDFLELIDKICGIPSEACIKPVFFKSVLSTHNFRAVNGTFLTQSASNNIGSINVREKLIESWVNAVTYYNENNFSDFVEYTTSFLNSELHRLIFFTPEKLLTHFVTRVDELPEIVGTYIFWRISVRKGRYA